MELYAQDQLPVRELEGGSLTARQWKTGVAGHQHCSGAMVHVCYPVLLADSPY